jgi:hypothetical protein
MSDTLARLQSLIGSSLTTPQNSAIGTASPLAGAAEQQALNTLLSMLPSLADGGNSRGAPGPSGAPSTGNVGRDAGLAAGAMGQQALGIAANPMGLAMSVPATMAAAAVRGLAGIPNPETLSQAIGVRGLANALGAAFGGPQTATEVSGFGPNSRSATPATLESQLTAAPVNQQVNMPAAVETLATELGKEFGIDDYGNPMGGFGAESSPGSDEGGSKGDTEGTGNSGPFAAGGLVALAGGGKIAQGPGGGLDDLIPTSIEGRRAAALSDGEFVIPADVVSMMGDGSSNAGARRLYDLVKSVRQHKTGTDDQAGPLPFGEILRRMS